MSPRAHTGVAGIGPPAKARPIGSFPPKSNYRALFPMAWGAFLDFPGFFPVGLLSLPPEKPIILVIFARARPACHPKNPGISAHERACRKTWGATGVGQGDAPRPPIWPPTHPGFRVTEYNSKISRILGAPSPCTMKLDNLLDNFWVPCVDGPNHQKTALSSTSCGPGMAAGPEFPLAGGPGQAAGGPLWKGAWANPVG